MQRHSKVFVPVWVANPNYTQPDYWLEEKENVYVLTEQELMRWGATDFYNWWNLIKTLQSKTNPQT